MKLKTTSWFGLVLMLAALVAVPVTARAADEKPDGWGRGSHRMIENHHERRLERLTEVLDLNPQQVEQWQEAMANRAQTGKLAHQEMRSLHQQIEEMAAGSNPDAKAIGDLVIQGQRLRAEAKAEREALHEEFRSILTPEQQERFELMREMRPERGRGGRHGRHGRGGMHRRGPEPDGL